jgi:hypothetical protein
MSNDLPPPLTGHGKLTTRMGLIQEAVERLVAARAPNILTDDTTAGVIQKPLARTSRTTSEPSTKSMIQRWG